MHIPITLKNNLKKYYVDYIILICVIILFNLFFPYNVYTIPVLKKGDIANRDIIAPFTFDLLKNNAVLKREREAAYDNVPPVIICDEQKTQKILSDIKSLKSVLDSLNKNVWKYENKKKILKERYQSISNEITDVLVSEKGAKIVDYTLSALMNLTEKGIISDKVNIPFGKDRRVTLKKGNEETIISETDLYDMKEAFEFVKKDITNKFSTNSYLLKYGMELLQYFAKPTLSVDYVETSFRRDRARNEVSEKIGVILKGEIIIRANDIADQGVEDKLFSLREYASQGITGVNKAIRFLVKNLIFTVIFILYILFINTHFKTHSFKIADKIFISIFFMLNLSIYGIFYQYSYIEYLLPVLLTVMLFSLLYSRTFALVSIIFILSTLILYSGMRLYGLLALLISGVYAIFLVKERGGRFQFITIIAKIGLLNSAFAFFIELYRDAVFVQTFLSMVFAFINAIVSVILLIAVLPQIERILGRVTKISLMEFADLNNPLLKDLSQKTSGTYNHSMIVSTLAENAALLVGGDGLLAKVGAYYHDIGKMEKPDYFIENQLRSNNPHKSLPPEISAVIIREHIEDGVKLAKRQKLPEQIIDFIKTHHGNSTIEYFYEQEKLKNKTVDESLFKYAGPLPESIETSLVMLADSVEASVRSLNDPNEAEIEKMIERIFTKKLNEGQLDKAKLSMSDLLTVKKSFFLILKGIYHPRLEYIDNAKE